MASKNITPVERIYIGGIDPERLSVEAVADRLARLDGVDLVSVDDTSTSRPDGSCFVRSGRTFFYLNARTTTEGVTALAVLRKAYNNVKWKGSTIRVEKARPHFLERLQEERNERGRKKESREAHVRVSQEETDYIPRVSNEEDTSKVSRRVGPPRNLRIRRRHGEEAFQVDTKPVDVNGIGIDDSSKKSEWQAKERYNRGARIINDTQWTRFAESLDKLRTKRAKHAEQYAEHRRRLKRLAKGRGTKAADSSDRLIKHEYVGTPHGKTFLNRAVHLRFMENIDDGSGDDGVGGSLGGVTLDMRCAANALKDEGVDENAKDDLILLGERSMTLFDMDSTESEASTDDSVGGIEEGESKEYVWSDEENDSCVEDDETGPEINQENNVDSKILSETDSSSSAPSVESSNDERDETMTNSMLDVKDSKEDPRHDKMDNESSSNYAWSNYDDDEDNKRADDDSPLTQWNTTVEDGGCKECSTSGDYDEFSSAVNFADGTDDCDEDEGTDTINKKDFSNPIDEDVAIEVDVSSNLDILGKLFPDMVGVKPYLSGAPDNGDGDADKVVKPQRPGWGSNGLIQRYDPDDVKSAKLFEIERRSLSATARSSEIDVGVVNIQIENEPITSKAPTIDGTKDESERKENESNLSGDQCPATLTSNGSDRVGQEFNERDQIYEQDKLEGIFQDARLARSTGGPESDERSNLHKDSLVSSRQETRVLPRESDGKEDSAFSFSFHLGDNEGDTPSDIKKNKDTASPVPNHIEKNSDNASSGFSFGFNVPGDAVPDNLSGLPASSKVSSSANKAEQRSIGIKRIRGMMLPRDEIFRLEAAFFEMNSNGNQNNWLAERFRLTKDWKYKSKKKRVS